MGKRLILLILFIPLFVACKKDNSSDDSSDLSTKFHTNTTISDDGKYTTHIIRYDSGGWGMFSITDDTLSLVEEGDITFFTSHYKRIK